MPEIFRFKGYRFFFFSNEGSPREPIHIHVRKDHNLAKFWIEPHVILAESYGMSPKELNELTGIIKKHKKQIIRSWNEYFES
jgi:hypothetical protein